MRMSRVVLASLAVLAVFSGCASVGKVEQGSDEQESVEVAIRHLVKAIDEAATIAYRRFEDGFALELTQISVTLETVLSKTTSEEAQLLVVTFDAERDESSTQTVTVLLKPPKAAPAGVEAPGAKAADAEATHPDLVDGLVEGIHAALLAASGAHDGLRDIHPHGIPFETSEITVEISFAVTGSASGDPSIKIFGVGVARDRSRSRETVHTISMVFQAKEQGSAVKAGLD